MNKIIHGDCLEELKALPDNSVDLVCTDPPYGYSFMGKNWDKAVPSVEIWKECLRVLKPGAFAFVMSAPRQDVLSQMIVRIGEAGFDTDFTSIYWTYASGFPKAANIGKMVDKRNGTKRKVLGVQKNKSGIGRTNDPNGKDWGTAASVVLTTGFSPLEGSYGGFQPKPAVEVIIVAMKPLSEKTFVDQALKNGKGVTWLDDCRVPTNPNVDDKRLGGNGAWTTSKEQTVYGGGAGIPRGTVESDTRGRFPANLLVSDDVLNDGVERIARTGAVGSGGNGSSDFMPNSQVTSSYPDSGSYSRYFDLDAWAKTYPFLIVPKASKGEKNEGLDGRKKVTVGDGPPVPIDNAFQRGKTERVNSHPTVKPLKLMAYLITLGTRPGDVVLDPFLGSGTTALAAKNLNRNYLGIEREKEYVEIAEARLLTVQPTLLDAAE